MVKRLPEEGIVNVGERDRREVWSGGVSLGEEERLMGVGSWHQIWPFNLSLPFETRGILGGENYNFVDNALGHLLPLFERPESTMSTDQPTKRPPPPNSSQYQQPRKRQKKDPTERSTAVKRHNRQLGRVSAQRRSRQVMWDCS